MPLNQIAHLQAVGIMNDFAVDQVPTMPDYKDTAAPLAERGRAYFAMNCAHCHNPGAWEASAERDFDFRYETPFDQTGILFERDRIEEALRDQEMPFIGTTLLDQEGVDLVIAYMESL
ncbi:MAG: c-type cytochrome, partial [Bacteroidota bacterium]